jgi:hypothetical protein
MKNFLLIFFCSLFISAMLPKYSWKPPNGWCNGKYNPHSGVCEEDPGEELPINGEWVLVVFAVGYGVVRINW